MTTLAPDIPSILLYDMDSSNEQEEDVSITTSLAQLAREGALPNIRHWKGRWQVRVHPFRAESFDSVEDAIQRAKELRDLRDDGIRTVPPKESVVADMSLAEATDALLARKRTRGGKRGPLTPRGLKFWSDSLRPWGGVLDESGERRFASREGLPEHQRWEAARGADGKLLAHRSLSSLTLWEIETVLDGRAAEARSQASYEQNGLLATLRLARQRGARFDDRLLELESITIPASTRGTALNAEDLRFLLEFAPEHSWRALSIMGTVGLRLSELLDMKTEDVNVFTRTVHVPNPKEKRAKTIPLMDSEAKLLAEQMIERPAGARHVFLRPGGTPWTRAGFYDDVTAPTRARAKRVWQMQQELPEDATTPFDGIDNHRLRHTAISLMAQRGLKPELIAQRVGHNDGGALVLKRYRHVFKDELRLALDELGSDLLEAVGQ